jgi:hypothetical protein
MFKLIISVVIVLISFNSFAAEVTRIECDGVRSVLVQDQPDPFVAIGPQRFELDATMQYYNFYCIDVDGEPHITFMEVSGNSYEAYYIGNVKTKRLFEVNYEAAKVIGIVVEE